MTTPTDHDLDAGNELPEALRWQLRALRRDQSPSRDIWPDIAARLQEKQPAASAAPARGRWAAPVALAATLALAIGAIGFLREDLSGRSPQAAQTASVVQREAAGLARQYDAALGEIAIAQAEPSRALKSTLDELDRNLSLIQYALSQDPDSTLLLDQLRRTYSHRLALAQRSTYS